MPSNLRSPSRYREEASRFRGLAMAAVDSARLRDSYLALAIEFERLADTLEKGADAARDRVGNAHDREARSQGLKTAIR
jgi:hypothetical protein